MEGLVDGRRLSLELALGLLARVRDEAAARELSLAIAVVDPGGHVIASQRMDGAALGAMELAVGKAYTSVLWATPTSAFTQSTQPGGDDWGWNTTDP
ncbi:MAG TPA: heme-binding protein, partial [Solirubrobacteraceae bacterium]|nr:heme-binding protein [Solirubrobacteraceae bacterium]